MFRFFYYISNEMRKKTQEAKISREHLDRGVAGWGLEWRGGRVGGESETGVSPFKVAQFLHRATFLEVSLFNKNKGCYKI